MRKGLLRPMAVYGLIRIHQMTMKKLHESTEQRMPRLVKQFFCNMKLLQIDLSRSGDMVAS
jgi:hypothetical protein